MTVIEFQDARNHYNQIADEYQLTTTRPLRLFIEAYTMRKVFHNACNEVPNKDKLKVMDLACGDGYFARYLKLEFPDLIQSMVGVDISDGQIKLANRIELEQKLGIQYLRSDAQHLTKHPDHYFNRDFDIAVTAYLLNYARTGNQLTSFLKNVYDSLKPGGKFIALNINIGLHPTVMFQDHKKYEITGKWLPKSYPSPPIDPRINVLPKAHDGDRIEIEMWYTDKGIEGASTKFDNYYLSKQTYESCFKAAGFDSFKWIYPEVDPEYKANCSNFTKGDPHFWDLIESDRAGIVWIELNKPLTSS
jgi:ubiquinone/menaquinone biosynthesis C-methylase UbiE